MATGPRTGWGQLLVAACMVAIVSALGCRSNDPGDALDRALQDYVRDGERVPSGNVTTYQGEAAEPGQLRRRGIFRIGTQDELNQLWAIQCTDQKPVPSVNFDTHIVLGCFLTRSSASSLRFYRMTLGSDRVWTAYFLGEMKALTQVRYNYPYCIAILRVGESGGSSSAQSTNQAVRLPVVGQILRIRDRSDGGFDVTPSGDPVPVR